MIEVDVRQNMEFIPHDGDILKVSYLGDSIALVIFRNGKRFVDSLKTGGMERWGWGAKGRRESPLDIVAYALLG